MKSKKHCTVTTIEYLNPIRLTIHSFGIYFGGFIFQKFNNTL